jgi:hypothetical protein
MAGRYQPASNVRRSTWLPTTGIDLEGMSAMYEKRRPCDLADDVL